MSRSLCLLILISCTSSLLAQTKTVRVLTVGNSFAENALEYLPDIVDASGHKLVYAKANLGGCTLIRHWNHVEKYEADPTDSSGRPYRNGKVSLADLLAEQDWDFVTLQQVSIQSHDPATYRPYAQQLHDYIRASAPEAQVLLHQIWAYRTDDKRFVPANKGKEPHTHEEMYRQVRAAYHEIADELNVEILPSGDAMYLADIDDQWGYRKDSSFDFPHAEFPSLPDQSHSLHVGWRWRKAKDGNYQLSMDGHHANATGEFLLGCVWFERLFGEGVQNNAFIPKGMDPNYAVFLRKTAHKAVESLQMASLK